MPLADAGLTPRWAARAFIDVESDSGDSSR